MTRPVVIGTLLLLTACKIDPTPTAGAGGLALPALIDQAAADTGCASHNWPGRGVSPKAFFTGMGLAYAKAICQPKTALSAALNAGPGSRSRDVLTFLSADISALDTAGSVHPQTVHLFTIASGLAQRESSGRFCVGADREPSADPFKTADAAEAGLFQTSWGAHGFSPILSQLFQSYAADQSGCELARFQSPAPHCSTLDAEDIGKGPGADWQHLTKSCPMFSIDYGLVVMRVNGGKDGEFGPIRHHEVQVLPQCASFYVKVEEAVTADPSLCDYFR